MSGSPKEVNHMNKTLTALVIAGAVALGACQHDTYTASGDHVRKKNQDGYSVTVVDNESWRLGGTLPREVRIAAMREGMTPSLVVGFSSNALAPDATFTSGYLQYTSSLDTLQERKCVWGPETTPPYCTATEVQNAQQFLSTYSAFAKK